MGGMSDSSIGAARERALDPGGLARLLDLERRHQWHPFTAMAEWGDPARPPLVLVSGRGAWLSDADGNAYLDGNSSIWTNIHGHAHPRINAAIRDQLERVAHTSFLGFTHPLAIELGERLCGLWPAGTMTRVFFSDDGSTAIEAALKMSVQFWQNVGQPGRSKFLAFSNAYHGDTMGASSLGGVPLFHERFARFHFPVEHIRSAADLETIADPKRIAAAVIEPGIQGVNGMRPWPPGTLRALRDWCDRHGVLLIADEVMTGFGRTGRMFACELEGVVPDLVALAKGLTGGYLPLAATLVRERIYEAFLGGGDRTFFYGHSYTANPLGCAAALASLDIFEEERTLERVAVSAEILRTELDKLRSHPWIREIRQLGMISGIELGRPDGSAFDPAERRGAAVCVAARAHGLLTRPIGDVIVLMPPLCMTTDEIELAVRAIREGIREGCGGG